MKLLIKFFFTLNWINQEMLPSFKENKLELNLCKLYNGQHINYKIENYTICYKFLNYLK